MPDGEGAANRDSLESIEILQARRCLKSVNVEKILTAGKDRLFKTSNMKKYNNKQEIGGYGGCIASGLKLGFLVIVITCICVVLFSCRSQKDGCGTENYKHRFNK